MILAEGAQPLHGRTVFQVLPTGFADSQSAARTAEPSVDDAAKFTSTAATSPSTASSASCTVHPATQIIAVTIGTHSSFPA